MKIGIQTWGSDGDILPFIALAQGLQAAGHQVSIAYTSVDNKDYSAYADAGGFHAFKAYDHFDAGMNDAMAGIVETKGPLKQFTLVMQTYFDPAVEAMYQASQKLCAENDVLIGHMMNHTLLTAAEQSGKPRIVVALAPLAIRTSEIPLFGPNLGPLLNRLTWWLGDYIGKKKLFTKAEAIRRRAGLAPLQSMQQQLYISKELTLIAASPTLTARRKDWGGHIQVCGELRFDKDRQPLPMPAGLEEFIAAGTPPVYLGFGSLAPYQSAQTDQLMCAAVALAGCRAIIQSESNEASPPNVFRCKSAPHTQVFPHCAAVVHHGGAGTTHTSLRAGCPSIVVEHAFDQQFWGQELHRLGVAGPLLHRNSVNAEQLAAAITATLASPTMQTRAQELAARMQGEDGVRTAIRLIEEKFGS
ncbi:4'-demethylrebeccamycin synthase [compost metagenome]